MEDIEETAHWIMEAVAMMNGKMHGPPKIEHLFALRDVIEGFEKELLELKEKINTLQNNPPFGYAKH